jgi:GST-like protein
MSMILYGDADSGSFTAEALFAILDVPFELKGVDLEKFEQTEDPYKAINPMGKVPALVLDDGTLVTESVAVLLTIVDAHPEAKLLPPPGSSARAWALRWLMFISNNIYEAIGRVDFPGRYTSNYYDKEAVAASAKSEIRWYWILFERELAKRDLAGPFAFGAEISALDLYVANIVGWENPIEWRAPNAPRIEALRQAVKAHPKVAPVWARHFKD